MSDELHHELRRHATALRGLARDLLRDPHAADDVTQQTMAKAWSARGELQPGPLGGWLRTTLRNFSRQWRRGERRRLAHEQHFGRGHAERTAPTSPAETLARREMLQAVTDAVLQLDEPYQTTVFLRYFEDLPPRAIARRTGCNAATVKSRLARGMAMLRQRLASSTTDPWRDWRPALASTFAIPLGSALLPVTTGVLLVKTSLKVTFVAAALCIGGLMLYRGEAAPRPPLVSDNRARPAQAATSTTAADTPATDVTERVPASPSDEEQPWLEHPYELELEITVLDPLGLPVAGHKPELAPPGCILRDAATATDDNGRVVVRLAARRPQIDVEVLDPRRHRRRITLRHGQRTRITLIDASRRDGGMLATWVLANPATQTDQKKLATAMTSGGLQPGLHPYAVFSESGIVKAKIASTEAPVASSQAVQLDVGTSISFSDLALSTGTFRVNLDNVKFGDIRGIEGLELVASMTEDSAAARADGIIEGTVFGEDGKSSADTPVVVLGSSPQPLQRTKTDAEGRFRFEQLATATFEVRAGGDENGLARVPVPVGLGVAQTTLQLRRDACIRGTLHDSKGEPIADAAIEWHAADGSWADVTQTGNDGTFVLANLPGASGNLFAWAKGDTRPFPVATEAGVLPDSGAVALVAELEQGSTLQLLPQVPDGLDVDRLRVRVRQVETGFSKSVAVPRVVTKKVDAEGKERRAVLRTPDQPWQFAHLPAGEYEVDLWLPGSGHVTLGRHWLDGKSLTDLGAIAMPTPGRLRFQLPADDRYPEDFSIEITSKLRDFDVRIETLDSLEHELLLAPGDYTLAWRRGEQPPHFMRFAIESTRLTGVPVAW